MKREDASQKRVTKVGDAGRFVKSLDVLNSRVMFILLNILFGSSTCEQARNSHDSMLCEYVHALLLCSYLFIFMTS